MSPASRGQKCHMILLWRSIVYPNQHRNMAGKKKKKRGGRRCVAGAPNSTTCGNNSRTPGISMHQFPKNEKTRALWVRFVQRHRSDFDEPVNQYAVLCSAHFEKSCFTTIQHKDTNHLKLKRVLQRGSVPTRDTIKPPGPEVLTERDKRQVRSEHLSHLYSTTIKGKSVDICFV